MEKSEKNYSLAGLIFVSITANTRTPTIISVSTIISKVFAFANRVTIPIVHIIIKRTGNRYFIIKVQIVPTLNVECSFSAGMKCSTP